MRDYWLTQEILKGIGLAYIALTLIALALALWLPKRWWGKLMAVAVVIGIFSILPRQAQKEIAQDQVKADEFKLRYDKAKALFDERCKTAGEKIYRTVEKVEGVLLKNTRGEFAVSNYNDPNWDGAGFPGESSGNQYIMEFLYYNTPAQGNAARDLSATKRPSGIQGYKAVDVLLGGYLRQFSRRDASQYTEAGFSDPVERYGIAKDIPVSKMRYLVAYENIADTEGRANWVAGGHVKIIDQKTNELLGEFMRYSFEPGLGNTGGERSPWAFARQCPESSYGNRTGHIRSFVEQVLKPIQGE